MIPRVAPILRQRVYTMLLLFFTRNSGSSQQKENKKTFLRKLNGHGIIISSFPVFVAVVRTPRAAATLRPTPT